MLKNIYSNIGDWGFGPIPIFDIKKLVENYLII